MLIHARNSNKHENSKGSEGTLGIYDILEKEKGWRVEWGVGGRIRVQDFKSENGDL